VRAAALDKSRKTAPVELIVNGVSVSMRDLICDGTTRELIFAADIAASSWAAIRVTPSGHTNPFFIVVDGKPIRASKHSAEWCLAGVEQCWKMKADSYHKDERKQAEADYEHARKMYRTIRTESKN
jgi:hypothetical protein